MLSRSARKEEQITTFMSAANLLARKPFLDSNDSWRGAAPAGFWDCPLPVEAFPADRPEWFETEVGQAEANCEAIASHFEPGLNAANGAIFHFGAGRGEMMETLRRHGFAAMGCEPSALQVERARRTHGFDASTLHCCNAEIFLRWLRRIGQKAQAIFFRHDLEHSLELHALLRRLADVLCENGRLVALLPPPNPNHPREAHMSFLNELAVGCACGDGHFEVERVECDFENRFMAFVLQKIVPRSDPDESCQPRTRGTRGAGQWTETQI